MEEGLIRAKTKKDVNGFVHVVFVRLFVSFFLSPLKLFSPSSTPTFVLAFSGREKPKVMKTFSADSTNQVQNF
jgi:hypothetical protein